VNSLAINQQSSYPSRFTPSQIRRQPTGIKDVIFRNGFWKPGMPVRERKGSRMSHLRLYRPECAPAANRFETEPVILPFRRHSFGLKSRNLVDIVVRAQTLHQNRRCPACQHPVVEQLELPDGLLNRNRLPIPGTATLVGFRCDSCHSEWRAGERS